MGFVTGGMTDLDFQCDLTNLCLFQITKTCLTQSSGIDLLNTEGPVMWRDFFLRGGGFSLNVHVSSVLSVVMSLLTSENVKNMSSNYWR